MWRPIELEIRLLVTLFFLREKLSKRCDLGRRCAAGSKWIWNENESFTSFYFPNSMTICNRTTTEAENVALARLSRLWTSSCDVIFCASIRVVAVSHHLCNNHFESSDSRESRLTFSQAKSRQCSRVLIANWPQSSWSFSHSAWSREPSGDDSFSFDSLIWNSLLRFSFSSVSRALMFAAWDFLTSFFKLPKASETNTIGRAKRQQRNGKLLIFYLGIFSRRFAFNMFEGSVTSRKKELNSISKPSCAVGDLKSAPFNRALWKLNLINSQPATNAAFLCVAQKWAELLSWKKFC